MKATNIPTNLLQLMAATAILSLATACKVTVYRTAIEVTPSSEYVETGKAITATASKVTYVEHSDGSTEQVSSEDVTTACTWSVSNEAILKAGGNGTFTGATPGDATIKATYANASGDCDVKVTGTRTGIEVRNLSTAIHVGYGNGIVVVDASGERLTFRCDYSFEYLVHYESQENGEWHKVSSTDGVEGPLSTETLRKEYNLKAGGYIGQPTDCEYGEDFRFEDGDEPEAGFDLYIPAHHYMEQHGCIAGYQMSIAGDTATSEVMVYQRKDDYKTEYKDTAVVVTFMRTTKIAHDVWSWQNPMTYYDTTSYTISNYCADFHNWNFDLGSPRIDTFIHMNVLDPGSWQDQRIKVESQLIRKKHKKWYSSCYDEGWENECMKELDVSSNQDLEIGCKGYYVANGLADTDTMMVIIDTENRLGKYLYIHVVRHYIDEEEFLATFGNR